MLHDVGAALRRLVGVLLKLLAGTSLAKEIPQAIELDVDIAQAPAIIGIAGRRIEQAMLLGDERFDVLMQFLIVHAARLPVRRQSPRLRQRGSLSRRLTRGIAVGVTKVREFGRTELYDGGAFLHRYS